MHHILEKSYFDHNTVIQNEVKKMDAQQKYKDEKTLSTPKEAANRSKLENLPTSAQRQYCRTVTRLIQVLT